MLKKILEKEGIIANDSNKELLETWKNWYQGLDPKFHYKIIKNTNGNNSKIRVYSMNMAKKAAEDLSKIIWAEGCDIAVDKDNLDIDSILDSDNNKFYENMPEQIERGLALGSFALIEFIENNEIIIDYVSAENMLPYKYSNLNITGLAVFTQKKMLNRDGKTIYHNIVTLHEYENKKYTKEHLLYISKNIKQIGKKVSFNLFYPDIENPQYVETEVPYFQVYRNPIVNNLTDNPMGISLFANSIDKLKAIDNKYDSFDEEFGFGRKRIIVDSSVLQEQQKVDSEGNISYIRYFDTNDRVFTALNGGLDPKEPIKEIDFNLRAEEHISAINAELNWYSGGIGLGQEFYSFDGQGLKTATEVMSEDNEAYRTATSYRNRLIEIITNMVKAIAHIQGVEVEEIQVTFEDGVITDTETAKSNARSEVAAGLMSKSYYLKKYRHLTEEEVKNEMEAINAENEKISIDLGFE